MKNDVQLETVWVDSVIKIGNRSVADGWSVGSTDRIIFCRSGDEIFLVAAFRPKEKFNSKIFGYSYTTFSGFMLHSASN